MLAACNHGRCCHAHGFTLVEVLIVVTILAILGAMVVPQFSNAARISRENVLREDLRFLRSQVQIYQAQHNGVAPGYPNGAASATPTEQAFVDQMTRPTSKGGAVGTVVDADYPLGPYLRSIPVNPINQNQSVLVVGPDGWPDEPSDQHGWIYQPSTLRVAADSTGVDEQGRAYFDY